MDGTVQLYNPTIQIDATTVDGTVQLYYPPVQGPLYCGWYCTTILSPCTGATTVDGAVQVTTILSPCTGAATVDGTVQLYYPPVQVLLLWMVLYNYT